MTFDPSALPLGAASASVVTSAKAFVTVLLSLVTVFLALVSAGARFVVAFGGVGGRRREDDAVRENLVVFSKKIAAGAVLTTSFPKRASNLTAGA